MIIDLYIQSEKARLIFYLAFLFFTSCSSYHLKVDKMRQLMEAGNFEAAAEKLAPLAGESGKDQLIYKLDYATALQAAGRFKESNEAFEQAINISEEKDYHSISKQVLSLALNEEQIQYKGETYEKVMIHLMKSLNYLAISDIESAQVEARRINEKMRYYQSENERPFEFNQFFNHYLSGLIWELSHQWDDALIDYQRAYNINPHFKYIAKDIVQIANKAKRLDIKKKYENLLTETEKQNLKDSSEIVLFFLKGWGPKKLPSYQSRLLARLTPVVNNVEHICLEIKDSKQFNCSVEVMNIDSMVIESYNAQIPLLLAKRTAALATKKVIQKQLDREKKGLGSLLYLGMTLMEQADLRQWSSLPKAFEIIRIKLKPGKYNYSIIPQLGRVQVSASFDQGEIDLKAGESKIFLYRNF